MERKTNLPQWRDGHSPGTKVPATGKSSFGGVVTPINVETLYQPLSNHHDREFVNKLCSELRDGPRMGFFGPRSTRFSNHLRTVYLNREVVTANLKQ